MHCRELDDAGYVSSSEALVSRGLAHAGAGDVPAGLKAVQRARDISSTSEVHFVLCKPLVCEVRGGGTITAYMYALMSAIESADGAMLRQLHLWVQQIVARAAGSTEHPSLTQKCMLLQALCAAVAASCRLHAAQDAPEQALLALQESLPGLQALHASSAQLQSLWLLCLAAAALSDSPAAADVLVRYNFMPCAAGLRSDMSLQTGANVHLQWGFRFLYVGTWHHHSKPALNLRRCAGLHPLHALSAELNVICAQAQGLVLLRGWDPVPEARFAARVQTAIAVGELRRDGVAKVRRLQTVACSKARRSHQRNLQVHCDVTASLAYKFACTNSRVQIKRRWCSLAQAQACQ